MIHPLPTIDAEFRSLDRHALGQDLCAQLSTYWFSLFDENGSVPTRGQFDPSMIAPLLPRLILLDVLHDAQTSGGLLIALAEPDALVERLHAAGIADAAAIGRIVAEPAGRLSIV